MHRPHLFLAFCNKTTLESHIVYISSFTNTTLVSLFYGPFNCFVFFVDCFLLSCATYETSSYRSKVCEDNSGPRPSISFIVHVNRSWLHYKHFFNAPRTYLGKYAPILMVFYGSPITKVVIKSLIVLVLSTFFMLLLV